MTIMNDFTQCGYKFFILKSHSGAHLQCISFSNSLTVVGDASLKHQQRLNPRFAPFFTFHFSLFIFHFSLILVRICNSLPFQYSLIVVGDASLCAIFHSFWCAFAMYFLFKFSNSCW